MADLAVWQRTIVDEKGDIIPGAEVEVRSYPGGSLITLYEGPDGAQAKGNPFSTGSDGFARFWAESQRAEIVAHGAGSTIRWVVDLINADEVIGDAVSEATAAAAAAVVEAEAAADRAEAARDATQLNAHIYPTTAAGLAATTDGDYFSVPSEDDDEYLILYRNDDGNAEEISRYPSTEAVRLLLMGRWIAPSAVRGDVYVTPLGTSGATVEWSGLHLMTGDGAARQVQDWPSTGVPNNTALYIDTTQIFATEYEVTQAPLDHQLQESFVKGANYLLVAVRNGQVFGPVADIGHAAALQRDKLSVADSNARMEYSFIRLVNIDGTGSALTGDLPGPLSQVPVTGYFGWRMPANSESPMSITFGGNTYAVKTMHGEDPPAGALPFGTDVIARVRGDGTVRLVGVYGPHDLPDLHGGIEYTFLRLINVGGSGSAVTADIPAALKDVPLTGYFGWRMPANSESPMTLTVGEETYTVKDWRGDDLLPGALPFGADVIARVRGDGTVRLVGIYNEDELPSVAAVKPRLPMIHAIAQAVEDAPGESEGELLIYNPTSGVWTTMNIDEATSPMKKLNDIDASGAAGLAPQTIVRAADAAQKITVANVAESGMIAIGLGGKEPVINGSGSLTLAPGAVLSLDYPPAGDVRVLSDVAGTPFTSRVKTARPYLSAAKASADALLDRYAGTLTARQRNAVRSLYAAFLPVLDQFLYLYVLASPDEPLALLNWAGDNAATPVASPAFVAGQGYTLNGTTQHLMTGKTWAGSPFGAADRMMMAVAVDETINGATRAAISSGNSAIEANRSTFSHGFRSANISTDTITGSAAGGLIVAQRSDLDSFAVLRNGKEEGKLYREGASNLMSYEHVIGAGTGSAGPTIESTHWAGTVQLAAAGNPLPEKEWSRINAAWVEYLAEIEA